MSRITEIAAEEADRAEADELEEREEEAEQAAELELERPAGEPEEPTDKQIRELQNENARHLENVRAIMGGFVDGFEPCETCNTLGLEPPGPKPRKDPNARECPDCRGFGRLITGSRVPNEETISCLGCGGRGFQIRTTEGAPAAPAPPAESSSAGEAWGTPSWMGDPNMGRP